MERSPMLRLNFARVLLAAHMLIHIQSIPVISALVIPSIPRKSGLNPTKEYVFGKENLTRNNFYTYIHTYLCVRVCVSERERERERESVCVCVFVIVCVCVCVCVCVRMYIHAYMHTCIHT